MTHDKRTAILNEGPWRDTDGNLIQVKTALLCLLCGPICTLTQHKKPGVEGCSDVRVADMLCITGTWWQHSAPRWVVLLVRSRCHALHLVIMFELATHCKKTCTRLPVEAQLRQLKIYCKQRVVPCARFGENKVGKTLPARPNGCAPPTCH